jgi:hypothetical protein
MREERVEEKSREIGKAAEGYSANHWRAWFLPVFAVILGPALIVVLGTGVALLVLAVLRPLRVSEDTVTFVILFFGLLSVTLGALFYAWLERRWYPGDPRVAFPPPSEQNRRSHKAREIIVTVSCLPFGLVVFAAPRFQPLCMAAFLSLPLAFDSLAARRFGWRNPWRTRPFTPALLGMYGLYAIAVAVGMPELGGGTRYDLLLRWGLVSALMFLNMLAAVVYSRLQFRRLQHLVNEDPLQEGKGDA